MSNIAWKCLALDQDLDRSSHSLAVLGSRAYIFGGEKEPRTPIDDLLYIIDLNDGTVTTSSSKLRPSARVGAGLTADRERNLLYLWGGRQSKEMTPCDASLWIYDVTSDTWTEVKAAEDAGAEHEVPAERSYHCMAVLGDELFPPAKWNTLPSAPEPGRGGTVLCPLAFPLHRKSEPQQVLVRYGGFAGHELGSSLDVYDPSSRSWSTLSLPPTSDSTPEPRSVHALIPFPSSSTTRESGDIVALMLFGERDPAPVELGHNGAGKFHSDVWALRYTPSPADKDSNAQADIADGFSFQRVHMGHEAHPDGEERPEPRGWFGADLWTDGDGAGRVVVFGGLNGKNERLGDLWLGKLKQD
ncbi:hypothetical protein QFC21_000761 [Naganishia friedmannii]|uniref:Uncharacterized protein n=1 Tax=Naganishia friedmannii TaxID=89922 RepID=A0ACC2W8D7_9TREE|nr:hypothetical protein QFC21_000761 [Naganishia friedmannii]